MDLEFGLRALGTPASKWVQRARGISAISTVLGSRILFVLTVLATVVLAVQPAKVNAQSVTVSQRPSTYTSEKVRMNAWTLGLAGGLLEGAPIRFAAEIARVVDDGPNMHPADRHPGSHVESELTSLPAWRRYGDHQLRREDLIDFRRCR